VPREIEVTLAARVRIPTANLPPELRDRLVRVAAFPNPVFYERGRARLSIHKTPRVIACHEHAGAELLLPRACLDDVIEEIETCGATAEVDDIRSEGAVIKASFNGALSDDQHVAVAALARHDAGVLVAPP
jgi:hypothetical protein